MKVNFTFDYLSLGLTTNDYLLEMGYRKCKPQSKVMDMIHYYEQELTDRVKALCTFTISKGILSESKIILDNAPSLHVGNILGHLLEGSVHFAIFAATAGLEFQSYYDEMKRQDDMLSLFILDTMGSCIVEKAGDLMEQHLGEIISPHQHTARFSPGYCGWTLNEQQNIFHILGRHPCNIALADSFLMYPLKSISGVIGIGDQVNERKYGCDICNLKTCYKRKNKKKYDTYK
ncbi:vitamin B12 dependent-methionine synthase activation domain-containing protein [Bacteroides fragilis]|jgi:hypothetical protein|uniref:vitamin B12 dependent-methionine synthase activation domain-containing protein n=1 Tax=Bacteroides fragilis TaxID=817 RepID=UPI00304BF394|nr:hypothetical protein [Bacteroides fragilis]